MLPAQDRDDATADRLALFVRGVLHGSELPMFSKRLIEILSLSNADRTSAQKLATLVLEDYALTFKLLRMANSFHYNRSNRPIESVSRAIVVLGMQTVLKLAGTLTFLQYFEQHTGELRRLMIRSMVSAHAAGITAELGRFQQREEAYLAAMFQNLGEVLVAHHSPLRLAAVRARIGAGHSPDEACVDQLGFTFDRLASVVAAHWKLSPYLTTLWDRCASPTELTLLARFGNELTRLMCDRSTAHHEPGITLLLMRYGAGLRLSADVLGGIWEQAVDDMRATFANLGVARHLIDDFDL